jgi:hypothetical protein
MMLSLTPIAETLVVRNLHVYVSYTLKRSSPSFSLSLVLYKNNNASSVLTIFGDLYCSRAMTGQTN